MRLILLDDLTRCPMYGNDLRPEEVCNDCIRRQTEMCPGIGNEKYIGSFSLNTIKDVEYLVASLNDYKTLLK